MRLGGIIMSIYKETIELLKLSGTASELYRFQGAKSYGHFNIRTSKFNTDERDSYVYFSSGMDHHKYFTMKRIRQMINKMILDGTPYEISSRDLRDFEDYKRIRDIVINSDKLEDLYSVKLITDHNFTGLIKDNAFFQQDKATGKPIEKVDRRVYGGGYGVATDWKDLLSALTLFNGYQKIDRNAIIELLAYMRRTGKVNQKENMNFLLMNSANYNYELNPSVESTFTKYKIMEALEKILEEGTYNPEGELGKHPTETIKRVVEDYEANKSKVLRILDNHAKM